MPRPLTPEEHTILDLYSHCQLGMTPQEFYAKWQVNQEAIATICSRSTSTVRRWFSKGRHYRRPSREDLRHLAIALAMRSIIANFLLEHYQEIPSHLREILCPHEFMEPIESSKDC
ncbi:MAG: helix-turn-helix domain-containing protein [Elainellaceae cyanobacterium]